MKELELGVRLEGDFGAALISADNSVVVATDTMKNTVQVLAHRHLEAETEPLAALVARHFLDKYEQIVRVTVEVRERAAQHSMSSTADRTNTRSPARDTRRWCGWSIASAARD